MTKATHTPGPWIAHGNFIKGTDAGNAMDGYEYVAKVETEWLDSPVDRKQANADLIAAAPDLLAALQRMAQGWATVSDENAYVIPGLAEARAAIAKATGELQ